MTLYAFIHDYWPLFAIAAWFGIRTWRSKKVKTLLPSLRAQGAVQIDVRSPEEFAQGSAPGSLNIPLQELPSRIHEIPSGCPVILCCASGMRSGMAKKVLESHGHRDVYNAGPWPNLLE